jgi:hypothetical protein
MQGVTTVITNNDGGSPIDIGKQLEGWAKSGIGTNAAVYIGQGSVRGSVVGSQAVAATPAQMDSMRAVVSRYSKLTPVECAALLIAPVICDARLLAMESTDMKSCA